MPLAAEHDERIANRRAWENGLATIPDAEQPRNVILSEAAARFNAALRPVVVRLMVAAARRARDVAHAR